MKHKVALCIPTYERSDMVRDFLVKCSSYFFDEEIDIYYFDSSVSNDTEEIINSWPDRERLFYYRFPPEIEGDEKACFIYQCYGFKYDYDFVWLSNDSYQIQREALHLIMMNLLPEYDMVNISPQKQDYDHNGLRVFTNPEDYLWTCLYNIGRYGNVIVNKKTLLDGIDWEKYKYLFYDSKVKAYGNVLFYFIRLSELDQMRALYMPLFGSELRDSNLKKASNWRHNMFHVWCDNWVNAVELLPDCFKDKNEITKKFIMTMCIHDKNDFLQYRKEGIFNHKIYKDYKSVWEKIVDTPKPIIFLISIMPRWLIGIKGSIMKKIKKFQFDSFCKRYPRIFIYGTSTGGSRFDQYFTKIGRVYEGFCCSKRENGNTEYCNHPVYEIEELKDDIKNIGFIIVMQEENFRRVKPTFDRLGCNYYRDGIFEGYFSYELGYRGASWYINQIR